MRKRLLVVFGTVIALGLAPAAARAEGCGDYPLPVEDIFSGWHYPGDFEPPDFIASLAALKNSNR